VSNSVVLNGFQRREEAALVNLVQQGLVTGVRPWSLMMDAGSNLSRGASNGLSWHSSLFARDSVVREVTEPAYGSAVLLCSGGQCVCRDVVASGTLKHS
jgi:hypothetical protein